MSGTPSKQAGSRRNQRAQLRDYHTNKQSPVAVGLEPWPLIAAGTATAPPINPSSSNSDCFSTQKELAVRLRVCVATLRRARAKGRLAGHKFEGQWRYSEQQIAEYLKRTEKPLRLYGGRPEGDDLLDVS